MNVLFVIIIKMYCPKETNFAIFLSKLYNQQNNWKLNK